MKMLISGVDAEILKTRINDAIRETQYADMVYEAELCVFTQPRINDGRADRYQWPPLAGRIYCTYLGKPDRAMTEEIARVLADALRKIDGLSPEKNKRLTIKSYSGETNEICFAFNIEKYDVEKKYVA